MRKKPKTIAPVRPNVGIELAYRKRLTDLVDEMHASLLWFIRAAYRANTPEMAQDESPAAAMQAVMSRLARRWQRRFDQGAKPLGDWFATSALERSDKALQGILRKSGFSVNFKLTPEANDVMQATISAQVGLIKSIASEHLAGVQGIVMRSVQTGRDLGTLTKEIEQKYGVTRKRAAFIAQSQNNIATATITRVRQQSIGVREAIWVHSAGGKTPRPEHVAFNGKRYDIEQGAYLEGKWTWPGVEPRCRCTSRSILPGFEEATDETAEQYASRTGK